MRNMNFSEAIDDAIAQAMVEDPRIIVFGEDVPSLRRNLLARFGPKRVRGTPISESAFLGAGVAAAMGGLRPVVEVWMVDFLSVGLDSLVNHAAKLETFTKGNWTAPILVRAPCGGGYGDGGQHEQSLWGWLAHIPGLSIVVPSTPADAGGLMMSALAYDGPVVFFEHKLLSEIYLDYLGFGGRDSIQFDVPAEGNRGPVPDKWAPLPLGEAIIRRDGGDISLISIGVGVHRALEAAQVLGQEGVSAQVVDLRTIRPIDKFKIFQAAAKTGHVLIIDEDYEGFGLSGELAAIILEAGISVKYARVCTQTTIPYATKLEKQTLPNVERIIAGAKSLLMQ
jgi:acetoin:2,6-dichlorophenolindophenol oxidoreductase subunit beta